MFFKLKAKIKQGNRNLSLKIISLSVANKELRRKATNRDTTKYSTDICPILEEL